MSASSENSEKRQKLAVDFYVAEKEWHVEPTHPRNYSTTGTKAYVTVEPNESTSPIVQRDRGAQDFYANDIDNERLRLESGIRIADIKQMALNEYQNTKLTKNQKLDLYVKTTGLGTSYSDLVRDLKVKLVTRYKQAAKQVSLTDCLLSDFLDDMDEAYRTSRYPIYDPHLIAEFEDLSSQGHHASKYFAGVMILSSCDQDDLARMQDGVGYLVDAHQNKVFNALNYLARWFYFRRLDVLALSLALISVKSRFTGLSTVVEITTTDNLEEDLKPEFRKYLNELLGKKDEEQSEERVI